MKYILSCFILLLSACTNSQVNNQPSEFLVNPYLQIGKAPSSQTLQLLWHASVSNDIWLVDYKNKDDVSWRQSQNQTYSTIAVNNMPAFRVYNATLNSLTPGSMFQYRVSKNGKVVFSSEGKAMKSPEQPYRLVISGDMGAGTKQEEKIAHRIYKSKPDLVAIAGDIVYDRGLISEYKARFWPIYNNDVTGIPLMHSVPFVAAVGNHDADTRDLDGFPDALAYYYFWDQPLNGPVGKEGGAFVPLLRGSDANRKNFLEGAGDKYPRMTNFSFDYGNAHWTVLDSDTYVDWTDSTLRDWVIKDLENSKNTTWRFVLFHHPGFNSSRVHYEDQQMRLLAPIFEKGNVDIVFSGHVHNYQRTYPLTFVPESSGNQLVAATNNRSTGKLINGRWTLDKNFDGNRNTKPNGVIYIITGAGGQRLYNTEQTKDKASWQEFTVRFESRVHSFTIMDVNGASLVLKQVDIKGKEVDKVKITK